MSRDSSHLIERGTTTKGSGVMALYDLVRPLETLIYAGLRPSYVIVTRCVRCHLEHAILFVFEGWRSGTRVATLL